MNTNAFDTDSILAVIPARGGSKGIPKKNIRLLDGKPLISFTIECALSCSFLSDVAVTSDDEEILRLAGDLEIKSLIKRPKELASDSAQSASTIIHALDRMEEKNKIVYEWVLMLQPTSPFRAPKHIVEAVKYTQEYDCDSVVSVVSVGGYHPLRMKIDCDGWMKNYVPQGFWNMRPRQELPPVFIRNGAIYLIKTKVLRAGGQLIGERCRTLIMDEVSSVNIDNPLDIKVAELIVKGQHVD